MEDGSTENFRANPQISKRHASLKQIYNAKEIKEVKDSLVLSEAEVREEERRRRRRRRKEERKEEEISIFLEQL